MNLVLFDDPAIRTNLLPFTFTRPVSNIRSGILTLTEKWELQFRTSASWLTQDYLSKKFPVVSTDDNLLINGALCPDKKLLDFCQSRKHNELGVHPTYFLESWAQCLCGCQPV